MQVGNIATRLQRGMIHQLGITWGTVVVHTVE